MDPNRTYIVVDGIGVEEIPRHRHGELTKAVMDALDNPHQKRPILWDVADRRGVSVKDIEYSCGVVLHESELR